MKAVSKYLLVLSLLLILSACAPKPETEVVLEREEIP